MRKKVDSRVRVLIENSVKTRCRSLFVIVGDRAREQVVNLHYILSKITTKKPSILWCYKQELGFSSHRKKRMKQLKKRMQRGQFDPNIDEPFELFVTTSNIRYCYYKESHNILGQTFGMCILQDFEAVTPNILCHTIETVEGGGIICIILNSMSSLRQLYSITMDFHMKLRTENFLKVEPRFNERFILSLATCTNCLIVDDELNLLPLSKSAQKITPIEKDLLSVTESSGHAVVKIGSGLSAFLSENQQELNELKEAMKNTEIIGQLVDSTVTCDQARCVMMLVDCILEKKTFHTVAVTAARGRGKSAALGLGIAAAIAYSYSNIVVTAPLPDMIKTVFKFILQGLEALGMKEHVDFELVHEEGMNGEVEVKSETFTTQISVYRNHRQTVKYVEPHSYVSGSQAELLVIDEAAAIPLPVVKRLLGSGLVFLSSTINGYEGTGRALSLKLIQEIKFGSHSMKLHNKSENNGNLGVAERLLKEITLKEPIRYAPNDPVENWLNELLCLDATNPPRLRSPALVPASKCQLYLVNRDALFSYHKSSEEFLHNLMALFVSSHYKNSPNDLLLLSDAPAHQMFVLLPPVDEAFTTLPDIYCAIQVSIEGKLSTAAIQETLGRGLKPSGDLVAWTLSQYFCDEAFGVLTGVRIVRIASHPHLQRMGYGSESIRQLIQYFEGSNIPLVKSNLLENCDPMLKQDISTNGNETDAHEASNSLDSNLLQNGVEVGLHSEVLTARDAPPLLHSCGDTSSTVSVDYFATSFGLTLELYKFWNKLGFEPTYVRQKKSEITGENSAILMRLPNTMLQNGAHPSASWISQFVADFRTRFIQLLSSPFTHFSVMLSLSLLDPPFTNSKHLMIEFEKENGGKSGSNDWHLPPVNAETISQFFTEHDLVRLRKYARQLADHHLILDLLPTLSWLFFSWRLPGLTLSYLQCAIVLAMGCQRRSSESIAAELSIPHNQAMALFNKAVLKISSYLQNLIEKQVEQQLFKTGDIIRPIESNRGYAPILRDGTLPIESFEAELQEGATEVKKKLEQQRKNLISSLSADAFKKYSLEGITDADFDKELKGKIINGSISIKRKNLLKNKGNDNAAKDRNFRINKKSSSKRSRTA